MDVLYQIMIDYGVFGFFIATFLAGSFIPFSSEVVMIALITAGVDPVAFSFGGPSATPSVPCSTIGWAGWAIPDGLKNGPV